jgi:hypothetical protein
VDNSSEFAARWCINTFSQEHKDVCDRLFVIEVVCDEYETESPHTIVDPVISTYALTGIRPRCDKAMQVYVDVNGTTLTALLNMGLTRNFIDLDVGT